ncbi:uncharacterized protein LOC108664335 [Hyalella azteca]|uniref:Uncharacterized protein LOC108664335 n=1 Tax=Hyalella azteca TaxID=294128 RepID=A0A8B7MYK9_HYAAZ|nr:uncharacterized protein LOC108664335 [Hyalella azteca]
MQGLRDEMMACSPRPSSISEAPTTPTTPTAHPHHHHHLPSSPTVASSPPLTTQPPASTLTSLCNMASETASLHHTEGAVSTCTSSVHSYHLPSHSLKQSPFAVDKQAALAVDKHSATAVDKQAALAADKQAALSSKLRLAKSLASTSSALPSQQSSFSSFRASLMDDQACGSAFTSPQYSMLTPKSLIHGFSRQNSDMDISNSGRSSVDGSSKLALDSGDTDIHVMSPSLVNSQVLSKTRPLSPIPGDLRSSSGMTSSCSSEVARPMAQTIAFQTLEFQRTPKLDMMSLVSRDAGSDPRETLSDLHAATHPTMGHPSPSALVDGHPLDRSHSNSSSDRTGWERRSVPQRNSWSRRRPASANFLQEKEALKGSVREMLDSNESMASLSNADLDGPQQPPVEEPKTGSRGRGGRGRRRPRLFKLKFHHQALPPEYLDHYEASLRQEHKLPPPPPPPPITSSVSTDLAAAKTASTPTSRNKGKGSRGGSKTPRPITIHEAGHGATEALLRELLLNRPHLQQAALHQAALARAQSVPSIMMASRHGLRATLGSSTPSPVPSISEEDSNNTHNRSLDGTQKRDGRRSRHSDGLSLGQSLMRDASPRLHVAGDISTSLGSQYAAMDQESMARSRSYTSLLRAALADQNEPLNLCVRDSTLKLDGEACIGSHRVKEEPIGTYNDILRPPSASIRSPETSARRSNESRTPMSPPLEYGPWAAPLGHHPHWMHDYRLKTEDGLSSGQSTPSLCSQSSHLPPISPPVWPHFSPPPVGSPHPHSPSPIHMTPPHRNVHSLLKESLHLRLEEAARERLTPSEGYMPSPDRMSTDTPTPIHLPQSTRAPSRSGVRKKRSSMHMPSLDPNTEVSICKFKFTGGPNPMLEEKKMVSVDSAGTMRYFNGGERGISRDHRTTASQLRLSGKFLGHISKNEKDNKKIRLESHELAPESLVSQSSSSLAASHSSLEPAVDSRHQLNQVEDSPKRKRRSKKASVRERFEQTLRERGLLIQTQQVESAEGATYCKFRQLRKITRYLFRSWKDYLPGQLPEEGALPADQRYTPPTAGEVQEQDPRYAPTPR